MNRTIFPTSNGVVAHNKDKVVFSAVNCEGNKKLKSFRTKNKVMFWHFPFARGVQFFFCGIVAFLQALTISIDLCQPKSIKEKEINKYYQRKLILICGVAILGFLFAAIVLGFLPGKLGWLVVGYKGNAILRNLVIALFKITLFYLFVLSLRIFPVVTELFRFNMAGSFIKTKKEEKLNSLSFLNYLIFVFILDFLVVTLCGVDLGFWYNLAFHIAIFLCVTSVAYEILWLVDFLHLNFLCYLTAFLVFAKPSRTHKETVYIALTELNLLSTQKDREFMNDENKQPFSVVYAEVKNKLANAGINEKSESDWIIATVLGKNRAEIKLIPFLTDKQYEEIMKVTERRAKGESLDNIFGWTEFYGLVFDVNKKVLTPRMETEILVEQVLNVQKNFKKPTILDLGTGSGAIAISIAKNCDASVTAVDVSKTALATAQNNAQKNSVKVEFLHSNLFEGLKKKRKFDIIVSNPPYIPTNDIPKLDQNVLQCDPMLALDGGEDGLDFYREITKRATSKLNKDGYLFYEIGKGQAGEVRKILKENGFEEIKTIKDYNKIERIVCGKFRK